MIDAEIREKFMGIDGINEAKKIYKVLAKELHPDVGGSDAEFKLLNEIYNEILENGISISDGSEFDLELEKVISKILHYENITIEVVGSWIWLSGETRAIKFSLELACLVEKIRLKFIESYKHSKLLK
ncbi:MAG: J domain-containing protein [Campylobacterota bacterium]|nr:J domain-containing protein [Campylobacterota bacterium]